ncbi:zinc finger protein 641-like [Mauremys mutica]|uniref:zinc finger protein 641-like n=1 Tax=Mauremys mutica TaxID=74926 RepID=UPI001D161B1B|nr:zinc finger protein 641-like [Mauremys mutica]
MQENYETVTSLGFPLPKPELIVQLERGEEPWVPDLRPCKERRLSRCPHTGPLWVPAKNVRPWHDDVASKPQEPDIQLQSDPNRDLSSVPSHKDGTKGYLGAGETTGAAGSANAGE